MICSTTLYIVEHPEHRAALMRDLIPGSALVVLSGDPLGDMRFARVVTLTANYDDTWFNEVVASRIVPVY